MKRDLVEMALAALVVIGFALGLYIGGVIHSRKVAPDLAASEECLEHVSQVGHAAKGLDESIREVMKGGQ